MCWRSSRSGPPPWRCAGRRSSRCWESCSLENGLALAALRLPNGSSLAIEFGVAFDSTLIALVAAVFHERIFTEFGAGDIGRVEDTA